MVCATPSSVLSSLTNAQNNILFTIHETASTLTAQLIPTAPTAPPSRCFQRHDHPCGRAPADAFPTPLLYVSNRNISRDTIATFEFVNGTDSTAPCMTNTRRMMRRRMRRQADSCASSRRSPRACSMSLGRVDGGGAEFIIAGANTEGGGAVFQRVDGGRNLTLALAARNLELGNRASFVFVESGSA
ncbi:hypothetical protein FB451DRAFT_686478 [Mycena latifolia]|nr:hypothetical protein FB451DRAFT_686478 [Mycena latifolia]